MKRLSMLRYADSPRRRARGVTLVEAMVALLVMSFGMMALIELMNSLHRSAELARQRGEALRLARSDIAVLRDFTVLSAGGLPNVRAYDDISAQADTTVTVADSQTAYTLNRQITAVFDSDAASTEIGKDVQVRVSWTDRAGKDQSVQLVAWIARADPAFSGSLTIAPPVDAVRLPAERNPAIPKAAKDLGDGSSGFKPSAGGGLAWVFNNLSGAITKICNVDPAVLNPGLSLGALQGCSAVASGYLLAGTVSFSYGAIADPVRPKSPVLAVHAFIDLVSVGHPAPPYECFDDAGLAARVVSYFCLVYGNSGNPSIWKGTVKLSGLNIGTDPGQFRVCRYTADYNLDKKESNDEHPLVYLDVGSSLARQNFLVVKGNVDCPKAPAVDPASGVFVDYSTKEVQPAGVI